MTVNTAYDAFMPCYTSQMPITRNVSSGQVALTGLRAAAALAAAPLLVLLVAAPGFAAQAPVWGGGGIGTLPSGVTATVGFSPESGVSEASQVIDGVGHQSEYDPEAIASGSFYRSLAVSQGHSMDEYVPMGTYTIEFSEPVTNPRLHLAHFGQALSTGGSRVVYQTRFELAEASGPAANPVWTAMSGFNGYTVTPTQIEPVGQPDVDGSCSAANVCGSLELQGTYTSIAFATETRGYAITGDLDASPFFIGDLTVSTLEDCSNAAPSYGPASHTHSDLALGALANTDQDAVLNTTACSEPTSAVDADPVFPALNDTDAGQRYRVTVPVSNGDGTGVDSAAAIAGWIDFNRDGVFGAGERADAPLAPGDTEATLEWTIPADVAGGETWARLRIDSGTQQLLPADLAGAGEVEDYPIEIAAIGARDANVTLAKTATATVEPGGTITYELTVSNTGTGPAESVTIEDHLDSAVTYGTGDCAPEGTTVTCDAGTLAPNETVTFTFTATTATTADDGQVITNMATASTASNETDEDDNTATATTTVTANARSSVDNANNIEWTDDYDAQLPETGTDGTPILIAGALTALLGTALIAATVHSRPRSQCRQRLPQP
jgi:uncharacterized repeat protein (TIGR01451 family)